MTNILRNVYRFKPLRTSAQTLAATLVAGGTGLIDTDWKGMASLAGMAGAVSFLQIMGEGGRLLADDTRVTRTAQLGETPPAHEPL